LLLLANFGKEASPQPIGVNISRETLAEMIGATRSRVSFFMNKFRKLGFISRQIDALGRFGCAVSVLPSRTCRAEPRSGASYEPRSFHCSDEPIS
jgi:hypothetical protein